MIKKISFNKNREYEWLVISQSYFQCALMNARMLRRELGDFSIDNNSPLKEIYGDYPQSPDYLIFPVIFNFKHGIEIYLKSIIGMSNADFNKEHNLVNLLKESTINDKEIKNTVEKYAYSRLLLPSNNKLDKENTFEKYPQGSPYDNLWLFPAINKKGQIEKDPEGIGFDGYVKWMQKSNLEIQSRITPQKIDELIKDIKFLMIGIRKESFDILKEKS